MYHEHVLAGPRPAITLSTQQINKILVIFGAVKRIRSISPVISIFLVILIMAGSFGFTLIHHNCFHCGTNETIASLAGDNVENECLSHHESAYCGNQEVTCCTHGDGDMQHRHSKSEPVFSDDCCTHEAERIVTDELVRSETQNEILPYFLAATVVAVIEENQTNNFSHLSGEQSYHHGRDLTTMLCRIRS